ncbi:MULTISPECIES: hypothetical protein [unclassified Knoellia]|uniref:hypothetical protein n=1 Tax=Knoellia altitudinis TaxID=3404795 RepID=UPI003615BE92
MKQITVGDLRAGDVVSIEDLGPVLVTEVSSEIGGSRFIHLCDLNTGEALSPTYSLGVQRVVDRHDIAAAHHRYRNVSASTEHVELGRESVDIAPEGVFGYTGIARPDVFPERLWEHTELPVEHGEELRPI